MSDYIGGYIVRCGNCRFTFHVSCALHNGGVADFENFDKAWPITIYCPTCILKLEGDPDDLIPVEVGDRVHTKWGKHPATLVKILEFPFYHVHFYDSSFSHYIKDKEILVSFRGITSPSLFYKILP